MCTQKLYGWKKIGFIPFFLLMVLTGPVFADDSEQLLRNVSSSPGTTENPEPEGEHAFIKMMNFRVPAQSSDGTLLVTQNADGSMAGGIDYTNIDGETVKTEATAKPLVGVYLYGPVITFDNLEASGYAGHGRRDAFAVISLDDGNTWKTTNLSNSADKSSFEVSTPFQDPAVPLGEGSVIDFDENGPAISKAVWDSGKLYVEGDAEFKDKVDIRNAITHEEVADDEVLFMTVAGKDGVFDATRRVAEAPCLVQAGIDGVWGPALEVENAPEECVDILNGQTLITDYPGDVRNVFHAVAGNKILVAWHSKFCSQGSPAWSAEYPVADVAAYLDIDTSTDFYLTDLFGVGGSQGATNYVDNEPVGEVPYSCLWSARGVLRENPEVSGSTEVVWLQAERLTSGARDVNRVEASCVAGAGCAVTWQEDPEGVRPGEGEGPGTGWSGATTASQTDIWYSFIEWEDFDIVRLGEAGDPVPLGTNLLSDIGTNRPKPFVPMMVPARLTNNARCAYPISSEDASYCNESFAGAYGVKNQCVSSIEVPLGPQGLPQPICVVDSNDSGTADTGDMPNLANTAASRPRLNLQPRDSDGDGITDDAWVIVVSEEDKGLGKYGFVNTEEWDLGNLDATASQLCDPETETVDVSGHGCQKADIGKNVFWSSFNMGSPDTSAGIGSSYSLVENVLSQGAQLNQPEVNWRTGTYYPPMDTADMWDFGEELNYLIFNTEIARRTSMMSQPLTKANSGSGRLLAMPLWKQGIINAGGPADISARRIVAPENVDERGENPYDAANMVCAWYDGEGTEHQGVKYFTDGSNPYYPKGLCMAAPINLSARTPFKCEASGEASDGECPGVADMTCVTDTNFGQLCATETDPENTGTFDKLISWYECPGWLGTNNSGDQPEIPGVCGTEPDSALIGSNMDDQSWYNPLEVSKAHRGFIDGSYVSMIYAWSPNYKLNTVGNDRYELYTRRSFDGGVTWTTTPASFTASNGETYSGSGTTTCETWRDGDGSLTDSHVCTVYSAGVPEQSRNVSQLKSMANTILDPRYTAAGGIPPKGVPTSGDLEWAVYEPTESTDILNPSRYFVVFEDGDNTTVAVGEAEPLNLGYGRGEIFGDHFTVWAEIDTDHGGGIDDCYPNNPHGDPDVAWATGTGFCNEFDTLEGYHDALSEEASLTASANGDFLYAIWGQINVNENNEFVDGDTMFRRIWYLDNYISETSAWTLPGGNTTE